MTRRTLLLLRWGVFVLAAAFLYVRLSRHGDSGALGLLLEARETGTLLATSAVVLLLMVVNWGLESRKWRLLVSGLEPISRMRAFLATIAGTSIGLITPNRVGEFAGRVLFLAPENRIGGAFATAVGSIAQFVVTVVFGTLGLIVLTAQAGPDYTDPSILAWIALCAVVAGGALLLYFSPELLHAIVARIPVIRRWERHAAVLDRFDGRMLVRVLGISMGRYAVFTVQFVILLRIVAAIQPSESLAAIPVAFLVATLIPTVMLTELGVRGSVAVAVISPDTVSDRGVFLASTALWLVNIALPAMAGAVLLLVARIRAARA